MIRGTLSSGNYLGAILYFTPKNITQKTEGVATYAATNLYGWNLGNAAGPWTDTSSPPHYQADSEKLYLKYN